MDLSGNPILSNLATVMPKGLPSEEEIERLKKIFPKFYDKCMDPQKDITVQPTSSEENETDQQKGHLVYKGFNDKMFELLQYLIKVIPEEEATYKTAGKLVQVFIDKDPIEPMRQWRESVKGNEDVVKSCTRENVIKFLKVAPTVKLLEMLSIHNNWGKLKPSNVREIWGMLGEMQMMSEMAEMMPTKLMTSIQNMVLRLKSENRIADDGQSLNIEQAKALLEEAIGSNDDIQEGMLELTKTFEKAFAGGDSVPMPPSYEEILQKVSNMR